MVASIENYASYEKLTIVMAKAFVGSGHGRAVNDCGQREALSMIVSCAEPERSDGIF